MANINKIKEEGERKAGIRFLRSHMLNASEFFQKGILSWNINGVFMASWGPFSVLALSRLVLFICLELLSANEWLAVRISCRRKG